ncbi:radical SAM protein [Thalassobaculum fulvum]|nr:radical SAM protein [Thalassobaculum fulvum]
MTNYMGASSFGSFAPVGESVTGSNTEGPGRRYLAVEIGETCQLTCRHCIYHRPKSRTPMPNERVLDQVMSTVQTVYRPLWITLAGKEPTIYRRKLVEVARGVRSPDTLNILMTNGLLLNDQLIDELADLIDLFDISVDGTRAAHDWMRGEGTYDRTWDRIGAILTRTDRRIGLIATAIHGRLDNGKRQTDTLVSLAKEIVERCGADGRVVLATSLYYGPPDDPMLLQPADLIDLISGLSTSGCPSRVLLTANYAHQWPQVSRALGIQSTPEDFDTMTGLPVVRFGSVTVILFNLSQVPQVSARISNDGLVFLGCNHLTLGDAAADHAIADLSREPLTGVLEQLADGSRPVYAKFQAIPAACDSCPDLGICNAGDRLSGTYFQRGAIDPFCTRAVAPLHPRTAMLDS